jgi:hypothetical protein
MLGVFSGIGALFDRTEHKLDKAKRKYYDEQTNYAKVMRSNRYGSGDSKSLGSNEFAQRQETSTRSIAWRIKSTNII